VPEPEFDVFLSHDTSDKPAVIELARILLDKHGIKPWLDDWNLVPGEPWQEAIEDALGRCASCAVIFGPGASGPWQNEEMRSAIDRQVGAGGYPVIPVLLPQAERGERSRLPAFLIRRAWVEFHDTIEDEHALRRLIAGIRGMAPGPDPDTVEVETGKVVKVAAGDVCPYRGLQSFDVGDSAFFHGREAQIGWLLAKLQPMRPDQRFLVITGSSGSGKSSLARAGLLAALTNGELPGSKDWPLAICKPGPQPLESLAIALVDALPLTASPSSTLGLMRDLAGDHRMLHLTSRFALRGAPADRRLVVLVDQFEEVFTLCTDEAQRQALISNLLYAAKEPDGQTAVVLTLRSDFYGRCAADAELASTVSDRGELVGPMADDELRSAIEKPARTAGLELEGGLTDLLAGEVAGQTGGLPLLEHALLQLWQRREGLQLTVGAYREIGGVGGALQRHAEEVFQSFTPLEKEACRRILLRLVQVDEQGRATKRRLNRDELISAADSQADREAAETVISKLTGERLLTVETASTKERPTVELAHEALLRAWKELSEWIEADREALRIRRRLDEAAGEWIASGRDPSFLYVGARLVQGEEWAASRPGDLSGTVREFLAASAAQRDQELEKRRRQRRRAMILLAAAAVAAALVAATMLGLWRNSKWQQRESERQQQINLATQMAGQARIARASNPLVSLLLATEAAHLKNDLPEAKGALLGALALSDGLPLGRTGIVAITGSSDRRSLATASQDGTVTIWSLASGPPKASKQTLHVAGTVAAIALSNDQHWLLVRNKKGDVRLLDLTKGNQGIPLPEEDWRYGDPFSPDSSQLMMDKVGTPVLHDLLHDPARGTSGVSNNPWNLDANAKGHLVPLSATIVTLSSKGQWLAWGEESGAVVLREELGQSAIELPGQGVPIRFLLFASGDRWLVTQGGSEAPRLWDLSQYPYGGILAATPDGTRFAVGLPPAVRVEGYGGAHPLTLQRVEPGGPAIWAFSQDGSLLAVSGSEPTSNVLLWKFGNPNPQSIPLSRPITAMAFSAKGDQLAIGGEGGAWLWDLGTGDPKLLVEDPKKQRVTALAFGPSSVATGWQDGAVRLFELGQDLQLLGTLKGESSVTALAFSRDGKRLAITYSNDKAGYWDDGHWDNRHEKPLENQDREVRVLAFSEDGHWLAGGGEKGSIQLWDLANPSGVPVIWKGHDGPVRSISFTKDAKELITTGQSVRHWPLDVATLIQQACTKAGRNLTKDEWARHAPPGEPFRKGTPCGAD